ncbi:NAD(P)H dehydrogenase (quinone) [termite gut metagenome]|uniref:NAD(P)H dehydrogenase (Quinone) n=1 Tax=termite gut metagenome TaxID=433724 RepID=A0A5J4RJW0_9ZZZZ
MKQILVVYYSWSGNTQRLAKQIQSIAGGDIFEITPVNPYPEDYTKCTEVAKKEIHEDYKLELSGKVENFAQYDIVFVGSPNWWSTIAPPVTTVLTSYNFSGKTVIPFCTHGGGRQANLFKDIAKLCPNVTIKKGFAVDGTSARHAKSDIKEWLQELEIIK